MWVESRWRCQTRTGDGGFAEPCEELTACSVGLLCTEGSRVPGCDSEFCCSHLCDTTSPYADDACPWESRCLDVFQIDEDVGGLCLIPTAPAMPTFWCVEDGGDDVPSPGDAKDTPPPPKPQPTAKK